MEMKKTFWDYILQSLMGAGALMLAILFHKEPEAAADAGSPVQMKVITDLLPDDEPAETPEDPFADTDELLFDQDAIDALFHQEDPEFAPLDEEQEESETEGTARGKGRQRAFECMRSLKRT